MISYDHFEVWLLHHKIGQTKRRNSLEMSNLFFDWHKFPQFKISEIKCFGGFSIPRNEKRNNKDRHIFRRMVFKCANEKKKKREKRMMKDLYFIFGL